LAPPDAWPKTLPPDRNNGESGLRALAHVDSQTSITAMGAFYNNKCEQSGMETTTPKFFWLR
jgi:hypothetical protein